MKIVYYIDTVIPTKRANMVHVMKMCQAFTAQGNVVTLRCDSGEKDIDLKKLWNQYGIESKFDIQTVFIPSFLRKYGHRFAAYYGALKKSLLPLDFDYAYSRSAASLFFIKSRIRYVYESHMEPDALNRLIEEQILRHKNCVGLVVISIALKKRYLEMFPFLTEDKITVLHDAADLEDANIESTAKLNASGGEIKIGYIGHLYPGKCMETLLPLAKRCSQYKFHIIGGTEEWVAHWKNRAMVDHVENLIFYGYVDNRVIGNYYRALDIAVLPFSKTVGIGNKKTDIGQWLSPLKLFEAMAQGKPILVSRLATIEEVMTDWEDCVMVEPDSIDDWEQKLNMLCGDPALQKRIGKAAKKKLESDYTWQERARKISAILNAKKNVD